MGKDLNKKKEYFSETEIRPDEFRNNVAKLFEDDIRKLMTHSDVFVRVDCPACGKENSSYVFKKMGQAYERCKECETVFINPRPTPDLLEEHYTSSAYYSYWNNVIFPSSESVRRDKIFKPRAERISETLKKKGVKANTLLEVGAGFGTFCEEMEKLGVFERIIAVEPTPALAESCRKRGIHVIEKMIENVDIQDRKVDVIASFEVIEHLFSPADFILHCHRILGKDGLLFLTCPNIKGFDIAILQELSDSIDPEHLNYFNPKSLGSLLQMYGFNVLESSTPGRLDAELVRKKILSGEFDVSRHPFLKRLLIDDWEEKGNAFQDFIADNGYSSHMWIVAQKKYMDSV